MKNFEKLPDDFWKTPTEEERKIRKEKDIEFDCTYNIGKYKDTFKEEYPKNRNDNIKDYCVDQAKSSVVYGDRRITSFLTPFGISEMESWFSKQIMMGESCKFNKKQLTKMIRRNPHLHNIIKTNLLDNLNSYEKQKLKSH